MALTLDQAKSLRHGQILHFTGPAPRGAKRDNQCRVTVGPRGGETINVTRVRVTGQVQTWKRSPERVRVPVKYGMYEHGEINETNLDNWHLAEECPVGI